MDGIDIGLYLMYLLFGIAALTAVLLPVMNLLQNPKSLIKIGLILVGGLAIFFVAFFGSSPALNPKFVAAGVDETGIKFVGAGLVMLYTFLFGSLLAMVVSEITKLFK